jgi:uncharacterized protein (DUF1015 family)
VAAAVRTGAVVRPFRALRFDPARVDPGAAVAPPYDVIDAAQRERLLVRSHYNVVRLSLPDPGAEENVAEIFRGWLAEGALIAEQEPAMYWLVQDFRGPDGVDRTRAGVLGALSLDGTVRPHERTMVKVREGRLALMRLLRANVSPIFAIHDDPGRRVAAVAWLQAEGQEPLVDSRDEDGTRHRLYRLAGEAIAREIAAVLDEATITIADGHHRFETARAYRDERRAADGDPPGPRAYDYALACLGSANDPGLQIFATHRVVRGIDRERWQAFEERLRARFQVDPRPGASAAEVYTEALSRPQSARALGVWRGAREDPLLVTLPPGAPLPDGSEVMRRVDAALAGALVLDEVLGISAETVATTDRVGYDHRAEGAAEAVAAESAGTALALLVRPPGIEAVEAVAAAGETMPQKSTYFFPKVPDGTVFLDLTADTIPG